MPAWTEPRVVPPALLPAVAGAFVVLMALPVFLVAGWRVEGWLLGAILWAGSEAFGAILARLQAKTGNLAAAGVVAFGMLFRAIAVMAVVFAVAVSDKWLGLAAVTLASVNIFGGFAVTQRMLSMYKKRERKDG